jgi:hypothetical protein
MQLKNRFLSFLYNIFLIIVIKVQQAVYNGHTVII